MVLRLLALIRVPEDSRPALLDHAGVVYSNQMKTFEEYVQDAIRKEGKEELKDREFYNCNNFTKEIIVYSHHEIGWLSHIFNVYEAFALLQQHLAPTNSDPIPSSVWDQLIISRPSALAILSSKGYFSESSPNSNLLSNLLSSRNREVRHQSLLIVSSRF